MNKPLLFVPIETKVREFHGKLLMACVAAERGFDVVFGHQPALRSWAHTYGRGTYLDKSMTESKVDWYRRCQEMGNRLVAWDEEGLVFLNADYYKKMRLHEPAVRPLQQLYCWGDMQYGAVRDRFPDAADRLFVTGNPRFDTLRPEFRAVFQPRVEALRREFGRILLINTNFSFGNHFNGYEALVKQLSRYAISREPGFFEKWADVQRRALESFVAVIPRLSALYPDHRLIVRPHPSENHGIWNELAGRLPNVVVRNDGNVVEWILASEALVHFSCTTGIEAFMLEVPAIAYRKVRSDFYEQPLPTALSYSALDEDELIGFLDPVLREGRTLPVLRDDPARMAVAHKNIEAIDGPYAADRIADALNLLPPLKRRRPVLDHAQRWARRAYPLLREAWRERRDPSRYQRQKFGGMTADEINQSIQLYRAATGRFAGIRARRATPHCFWIESSG